MARMKGQMIRFGDQWWALIQADAERAGVSAAQFVRDTVIARVCYAAGQRGDPLPGGLGASPFPLLEQDQDGDGDGAANDGDGKAHRDGDHAAH